MNGNFEFTKISTESIVEKYGDMVYRLAITESGNSEDAQDIFQEVFLRLVRFRDRITSEEHLKAWLIRVTVNCSRKHMGSTWKKRVHFFESDENSDIKDNNTPDEYERIENQDSPLRTAVMNLPEKYRIVIYLHYYEDMKIEQISDILQEKESTIKSRLHRARDILKKKLKGGYDI